MKRLTLAVLLLLASITARAEPIVILTTGQSNMAYRIAIKDEKGGILGWYPAKNARSWNWDLIDGHVGTEFTVADSWSINLPDRLATMIASRFPDQTVYVINIAFFGLSIAHWLPGAPAPDVVKNILANVPPALELAGASRINYFFWWQGETPTDKPELYPEQFDAVIARLQAEPWFPPATPVAIFGVAPTRISKNPQSDYYNALLRESAARSPHRMFIDTSVIADRLWLDTAHPNGQGFFSLGMLGAHAVAPR